VSLTKAIAGLYYRESFNAIILCSKLCCYAIDLCCDCYTLWCYTGLPLLLRFIIRNSLTASLQFGQDPLTLLAVSINTLSTII